MPALARAWRAPSDAPGLIPSSPRDQGGKQADLGLLAGQNGGLRMQPRHPRL